MTSTIVAALTIGSTVRIDSPRLPDFNRTGQIVAIHHADSDCPSYLVEIDGTAAQPFGAGELVAIDTFTTIATADILDALVEVVDGARASGQLSPAWMRALDAAYDHLLRQDTIEYDHSTHALRVESATEPGRYYLANGSCQCTSARAGNGACWHRTAARLVRRALWDNERTAAVAIADHINERREELLASIDETLPDFAAQWDKAAQAQRWAVTERSMAEMYA